MGLEHLPVELFRAIAGPLSLQDHLSLCLVSKRLGQLSRPLVYRNVEIILSARYFGRRDGPCLDERKRNAFFRTLLSHPYLANYISYLCLKLDPSRLVDSQCLPLAISLLASAVNLRHLCLWATYEAEGDIPSSLLDAVPSTLPTLELFERPLEPAGLGYLLKRLNSLATLDLRRAVLEATSDTLVDSKSIVNVLVPKPASEFEKCRFFTSLLPHLPNLTSFEGSTSSVRYLKDNDLPLLGTLKLCSGVSEAWNGGGGGGGGSDSYRARPDEFLLHLSATLRRTPKLKHLEVFLMYCGDLYMNEAHQFSILDDVPKGIQSLILHGEHILPPSSLIRFLGSTSAAVNLSELSVSHLWTGMHSPARIMRGGMEGQVEELCAIRNTKLTWLSRFFGV